MNICESKSFCKHAKQALAVILSLELMLSLVVLPSAAVESTAVSSGEALVFGDYEYIILDDGTVEITGYTGSDTELIIPSEIDGKSVTSIGNGAFYGCTGLTSVTIGNSVTSIGSSAFFGCTGLTSIIIPDSVTSIDGYAFYNCTSLETVNYNAVHCSAFSFSYHPFEGCTSLSTVNIGESVESIPRYAFYKCTSLKSITIPDSVITIGYSAFEGCTGLTSVTIGSGVTSIGSYAFFGCTSLTSVTIPDSVTSIGYSAFRGCTGLTSVTIPNSVTSIGYSAFFGCTSLTSVTIPNSVTSIGSDAFYNTAWYNNQPDGLVYAGKVAYDYKGEMPENTEIVLKDGTLGIAWSAFEGCTGLISITIPDSVTSIGYGAFFRCTGLTSITIPDSVTYIGQKAFGYYYDWDTNIYKKVDNFTISSYAGSAAETYAKDNGFEFVSLGSSLKDNETGISVTVDNNAELVVETLTDSESIDKANVALVGKAEVLALYDISLLKDGVAVQPDGTAKVKIPTDNENAKVYRIEEDGTATDMNAVYENGYLVFVTDHFSVYAVAEPLKAALGDVTGDGKVKLIDAITIQKVALTMTELSGQALINADVNSDSKVNLLDAILAQKLALQIAV